MQKTTPWGQARELAELTPAARNRYVDFLRAASITVVVTGHWLMASPYIQDGELIMGDLLHQVPTTQWLTWVFQVMPLFFIVGGYSNGISWESARRDGRGYDLWLATRLKRLVGPVVPLLLAWTGLAVAAYLAGVRPETIRLGSQAALVPTWFLAVYIMVVVVTPPTHWAWRRFGMVSFVCLALAALLIDSVSFAYDLPLLRWINYAFVWLAVHQLGYLWRDGRITGPARALLWSAGGLLLLLLLVFGASYPVSMLSVPGEEISNSRPPTFALLALGMFHFGLVLALEKVMRCWLERPWPWTLTVLINGTIMTLYLWHITAMVLLVGLLNLYGGFGLGLQPDTVSWWLSRPLWIGILCAILLPFIALFGRFEQTAKGKAAVTIPAWRSIAGATLVCGSLAVMALKGIGAAGVTGIPFGTVLLAVAGSALVLGMPR